MRCIAIANQKGGVGKTTTAVNLAACAAARGKRVLLIDNDPQGNTTSHLGLKQSARLGPDDPPPSLYEVLTGVASLDAAIVPGPLPGLDVVPARLGLAAAELELAGVTGREFVLREALGHLNGSGPQGAYDLLLMDCPPSLGLLTINALAAVEEVMVPVACEVLALEGLSALRSAIELVQRRLNPRLRLVAVIPTLYNTRRNLSGEALELIRESCGEIVTRTVVRNTVRLAEAPGAHQPIILYDPRSPGADDYQALAQEVLWDA